MGSGHMLCGGFLVGKKRTEGRVQMDAEIDRPGFFASGCAGCRNWGVRTMEDRIWGLIFF